MGNDRLIELANAKVEEHIDTIKFYIAEGIEKETAIEMVFSHSALSKQLKDKIVQSIE